MIVCCIKGKKEERENREKIELKNNDVNKRVNGGISRFCQL